MSLARKLRAIFTAQVAHMTAYRAEIMIWMLAGTLSFVMMAVWIAQARSAPGGSIGGYDAAAFASYFLGTWITGQLLVVWVIWELDYQVRLGHLSPKLLRPLDPIWEHIGNHLAEKLVRLPFIVLIAAVILQLVPGAGFSSDPLVYLAFAAIIALAFCVRFLIEYCLGLLCFWMESTTSLSNLSFLVYAGLGGVFAPLSLYPPWLQELARLTPYPYIVNLPARMLSGSAQWREIGLGVLVLLGWLGALALLRLALWRGGLRRYGAVGA